MTNDQLAAGLDSFDYLKPKEKDSMNPWKSPHTTSYGLIEASDLEKK
jgi:hypothetical protein